MEKEAIAAIVQSFSCRRKPKFMPVVPNEPTAPGAPIVIFLAILFFSLNNLAYKEL